MRSSRSFASTLFAISLIFGISSSAATTATAEPDQGGKPLSRTGREADASSKVETENVILRHAISGAAAREGHPPPEVIREVDDYYYSDEDSQGNPQTPCSGDDIEEQSNESADEAMENGEESDSVVAGELKPRLCLATRHCSKALNERCLAIHRTSGGMLLLCGCGEGYIRDSKTNICKLSESSPFSKEFEAAWQEHLKLKELASHEDSLDRHESDPWIAYAQRLLEKDAVNSLEQQELTEWMARNNESPSIEIPYGKQSVQK